MKLIKGKPESVRLGVIESYKMNPDYVGFLDADLATPIEEIDNLLKIIKKEKTKEVVFASRIQLIGNGIKRKLFQALSLVVYLPPVYRYY